MCKIEISVDVIVVLDVNGLILCEALRDMVGPADGTVFNGVLGLSNAMIACCLERSMLMS